LAGVTLAGCEARGDGLVAGFAGIPDRGAAEGLQGSWIAAPRDELPPTKENEYYWADLIGMSVENMANERLGMVSGLIGTGANDVLRVMDDSGAERLLPFVDAVVHAVDRVARRIRVDWQLDWN
jgi:16S rRNA processing protein RimM